jgi:hypothetical protein
VTSSVIIDGALVDVPFRVVHEAKLNPGDYRMRAGRPFQIMNHSISGNWPQPLLAGSGPPGVAAHIADIWDTDPTHSGAHFVVDLDGAVWQLADAVRVEAYHAEGANPYSVGIEMCVTKRDEIYQATIDATVALNLFLCERLGIPPQLHGAAYRGDPLRRMETTVDGVRRNTGGPDCRGIFSHRDNTSRRGRGDAGDNIITALLAAGVEGLDYNHDEDLEIGRRRQAALNALDARAGNTYRPLAVDGLVGPVSLAAAKRLGFVRWRDVPTG